MALQAHVLDQLVVKEVWGSALIMILELSYVGSVNVDTETSSQKNGIDAHAADYLLDINRDILEVDTTLNGRIIRYSYFTMLLLQKAFNIIAVVYNLMIDYGRTYVTTL